ncbi:Amuc_1100 family pilus-like protein [Prosthecobacter sp.]|uniref:Amuc_1100 family pilus-like protein n=1 Tax=Prosthecobacter sp. TaxID=1965333 RepID=UPI002ABA1C85|nr:Amuc_1100 family pilus-like protein [Prosthecobacter sp.]MDZ4403857.1 Amuc_1100 family pilus-like protein [Prosthecobacter sp.]
MDWIRENKPLAAILGVILAGSLALGYLLFDAWSNYAETRDAYLSMGSQVAGLKGSRLAPTEDNVKAKQALVEEYAVNVNRLGGALLILQPPVQPTKDIEFQAKLKTKIAEARKAATMSKMSLPPEFAFGFDDYTAGLPKSAAAAAELASFLDAMDELVRLFMQCGVQSVDLLERSKLAIEQDQAASSPQRNSRTGVQPQQQMASAILEKRQISVILTLDQGPLQLLISRLANPSDMPFFTSLRLLRIENERQDGPLKSDVRLPEVVPPNPGGGGEAAAPAPAASDEIKPPPPATADSVPVIGKERLKVRMEIDLVKFLDAAKGVVAQPPVGR